MCSAAFPGPEWEPFAEGNGSLVPEPDKESLKDEALKKKIEKKKGGVGYLKVCEMEALSGVFWGDKELGGPDSAWHGHTHCL